MPVTAGLQSCVGCDLDDDLRSDIGDDDRCTAEVTSANLVGPGLSFLGHRHLDGGEAPPVSARCLGRG